MMGGVIVGRQHRVEPLAGAGMDHFQKLAGALVTIPVLLDADPPPVAQDEGGYVDRIAVGMFAELAAARDRPAIIGAECLDLLDLRAQDQPGGRLHGIARPGGEIGGKVAGHGAKARGRHADVEQFDAADRTASAAEILIGQGGEGDRLGLQFGEALPGFERRRRGRGGRARVLCRLGCARDSTLGHQVAAAGGQHARHCRGQGRAAPYRIFRRPLYHQSHIYHGFPG